MAKFDHRSFRQELNRLAKRGVVELFETGEGLVAKLTEEGKKRVVKYNLERLEIKKPEKWDGKWRLVIFDIPENKKVARETFRQNLKDLGFYQIQKSVFMHPFPCSDEIRILRGQYGLTPKEVMIMAVEDIEGEQVALRNFIR